MTVYPTMLLIRWFYIFPLMVSILRTGMWHVSPLPRQRSLLVHCPPLPFLPAARAGRSTNNLIGLLLVYFTASLLLYGYPWGCIERSLVIQAAYLSGGAHPFFLTPNRNCASGSWQHVSKRRIEDVVLRGRPSEDVDSLGCDVLW